MCATYSNEVFFPRLGLLLFHYLWGLAWLCERLCRACALAVCVLKQQCIKFLKKSPGLMNNFQSGLGSVRPNILNSRNSPDDPQHLLRVAAAASCYLKPQVSHMKGRSLVCLNRTCLSNAAFSTLA